MNEKFKRRNAILPAAPGMDIVPPSSGTQIVNYEGLDQQTDRVSARTNKISEEFDGESHDINGSGSE